MIQPTMYLDVAFFVGLIQSVAQTITFGNIVERYIVWGYMAVPSPITQSL